MKTIISLLMLLSLNAYAQCITPDGIDISLTLLPGETCESQLAKINALKKLHEDLSEKDSKYEKEMAKLKKLKELEAKAYALLPKANNPNGSDEFFSELKNLENKLNDVVIEEVVTEDKHGNKIAGVVPQMTLQPPVFDVCAWIRTLPNMYIKACDTANEVQQ